MVMDSEILQTQGRSSTLPTTEYKERHDSVLTNIPRLAGEKIRSSSGNWSLRKSKGRSHSRKVTPVKLKQATPYLHDSGLDGLRVGRCWFRKLIYNATEGLSYIKLLY